MYYSLTGKLIHTEPFLAVINCGGVGYRCITTMNTLSQLPQTGKEATLFTHLNVREDALDLYGFTTLAEQSAFKQLIGVSGVGPKSALAILSDMTPDKLTLCIASGDSKTLCRAPGIGPKVAQRLILELKDKLDSSGLDAGVGELAARMKDDTSSLSEAISALCVLGYSQSEAVQALAGASAELPVDQLVKQGLKALSKRR